MTEPRETASDVHQVVDGVWRWSIHDDRIGGSLTSAHAVTDDDGTVLVDPLPLADDALERLGKITAICLTAACHQRSAWRYRRALGVPVYAPEGTRAMEEEPDDRYAADEDLPGGLRTVYTPGPEDAHYSFLLPRDPGVLFCSDLLLHQPGGRLAYVPLEYHDDPAQTRQSVERLLGLDFAVLCLDHGVPVLDDPHAAMRAVLDAG